MSSTAVTEVPARRAVVIAIALWMLSILLTVGLPTWSHGWGCRVFFENPEAPGPVYVTKGASDFVVTLGHEDVGGDLTRGWYWFGVDLDIFGIEHSSPESATARLIPKQTGLFEIWGRYSGYEGEDGAWRACRTTVNLKVCVQADGDDSIPIEGVCELGLKMQEFPEESADGPHEEAPGALIGVNADDDNDNDVPDFQEPDAAFPDDDLEPLQLQLPTSELDAATITLSAGSGADHIRVWDSPNRTREFSLPYEWNKSTGIPPRQLYVEGIARSDGARDIPLTLTFRAGDSEITDRVFVTVARPQIGISPDTEIEVSADDSQIDPTVVVFVASEDGLYDVDEGGSVLEWELIEGSGGLSDTETVSEDGVASTTLHTSTQPGDSYRVKAELTEVGVGSGTVEIVENHGVEHEAETALMTVVPGQADSIEVDRSQQDYPADEHSQLTLTATARDQHGNLVQDDTPVSWDFGGLGGLIEKQVQTSTAGGQARAAVRSGYIDGTQEVTIGIDQAEKTVEIAQREIDVALSSSASELDVSTGETATLTASFNTASGAGVADGTPVEWFTSNGQIEAADEVVTNGAATATLSAVGGRIDSTLVSVSAANFVGTTRVDFVSSQPLWFEVEHPYLAGDERNPGTVAIEQLDGSFRQIAYETESDVTIHGDPGSVVRLTAEGDMPVASYALDYLLSEDDGSGGTIRVVEDSVDDHDGTVEGQTASIDTDEKMVGEGALVLESSDRVTVPFHKDLRLKEFTVQSWIRPAADTTGIVIEQADHYDLAIDADGHVVFTLHTNRGPESLRSADPLAAETWSLLEAEVRDGEAMIRVDAVEVASRLLDGKLQPPKTGLVIGDGFAGHVDALSIFGARNKGGALVQLEGVSRDGTIQLDDSGTATAVLSSRGALKKSHLAHVTLEVERVDGGTQGISPASVPSPFYYREKVRLASKRVIGLVKNVGWGFAWGEGDSGEAIAADFAAGMFIYGDVRDIVKETFRLWPGGKEADLAVWGFAVAGLALEIAPGIGEPVDAVASAARTLLKRTTGAFRDAIVRITKRMIVIGIERGPPAAIEYANQFRAFFEYVISRGGDALDLLNGGVRSLDDVEDLARVQRRYGDRFVDTTATAAKACGLSGASPAVGTGSVTIQASSSCRELYVKATKILSDASGNWGKRLEYLRDAGQEAELRELVDSLKTIKAKKIQSTVLNRALENSVVWTDDAAGGVISFGGHKYYQDDFVNDISAVIRHDPDIPQNYIEKQLSQVRKAPEPNAGAGNVFEFNQHANLSKNHDVILTRSRSKYDELDTEALVDHLADEFLVSDTVSPQGLTRFTRAELAGKMRRGLVRAKELADREFVGYRYLFPEGAAAPPKRLELALRDVFGQDINLDTYIKYVPFVRGNTNLR